MSEAQEASGPPPISKRQRHIDLDLDLDLDGDEGLKLVHVRFEFKAEGDVMTDVAEKFAKEIEKLAATWRPPFVGPRIIQVTIERGDVQREAAQA